MKVIVAGSRDIEDRALIEEAMNVVRGAWGFDELVCGMARGVDIAARDIASDWDGVVITDFPANWEIEGKRAGIIRNEEMGEYADALVAVWDGESRGTRHMIETMFKLKKPVYVVFSS